MVTHRRERRVALGLEPRLADDLGLGVGRRGVALLLERRVAVLHRVVVRHLAEVDLARLPEALLALLLLRRDLTRNRNPLFLKWFSAPNLKYPKYLKHHFRGKLFQRRHLLRNYALLAREELRYVSVVALRDVLVPALLDLVFDHVVDVLGLGDAPGAVRARDGVGEVHDAGEVGVVPLDVRAGRLSADVPRLPRRRRRRVRLALCLWDGARGGEHREQQRRRRQRPRPLKKSVGVG